MASRWHSAPGGRLWQSDASGFARQRQAAGWPQVKLQAGSGWVGSSFLVFPAVHTPMSEKEVGGLFGPKPLTSFIRRQTIPSAAQDAPPWWCF